MHARQTAALDTSLSQTSSKVPGTTGGNTQPAQLGQHQLISGHGSPSQPAPEVTGDVGRRQEQELPRPQPEPIPPRAHNVMALGARPAARPVTPVRSASSSSTPAACVMASRPS